MVDNTRNRDDGWFQGVLYMLFLREGNGVRVESGDRTRDTRVGEWGGVVGLERLFRALG